VTIVLVAAGLLVMAALDFIRPDTGETVDLSLEPGRANASTSRSVDDVELHHLLPDATADLGRRVFVAGTVVGQPAEGGFWVRDLRDNIVFIANRSVGESAGPTRAGQPVRVRGTVALFPPAEQAGRLQAAGLVISAGSNLVREIKIEAGPGGIEILRD